MRETELYRNSAVCWEVVALRLGPHRLRMRPACGALRMCGKKDTLSLQVHWLIPDAGLLSSSAQVTVTQYHGLGGKAAEIYFFTVLEAKN